MSVDTVVSKPVKSSSSSASVSAILSSSKQSNSTTTHSTHHATNGMPLAMTNPTGTPGAHGTNSTTTNTSIINIVSSSSSNHGSSSGTSNNFVSLPNSHSSPHIDKSSQFGGHANHQAGGSSSGSGIEEIKAGSEVTALHKFKGRTSERELSFEFGDLIRIISIVAKVSTNLHRLLSRTSSH